MKRMKFTVSTIMNIGRSILLLIYINVRSFLFSASWQYYA